MGHAKLLQYWPFSALIPCCDHLAKPLIIYLWYCLNMYDVIMGKAPLERKLLVRRSWLSLAALSEKEGGVQSARAAALLAGLLPTSSIRQGRRHHSRFISSEPESGGLSDCPSSRETGTWAWDRIQVSHWYCLFDFFFHTRSFCITHASFVLTVFLSSIQASLNNCVPKRSSFCFHTMVSQILGSKCRKISF